MAAYYNEIEPYAAQWLRNLIKAGHIADGEVDTRSIVDVHPFDLQGFDQCHFFAGIGGWSHALHLAGWPDSRPVWTGSCPCQPFSEAGKGLGVEDPRHLWPHFHRLIAAVRPPVVMGEQVAAAVGKSWLDGVSSDLEGIGYACGAVVVPACAVDAPHRRDRLWFVAHTDATQRGPVNSPRGRVAGEHAILQGQENTSGSVTGCEGNVADAEREGRVPGSRAGIHREAQGERTRNVEPLGHRAARDGSGGAGLQGRELARALHGERDRAEAYGSASEFGSSWRHAEWAVGADGKARRVEPSIRLLANGVPARVGKLRAYGHAIVPILAAEIIAAYMEA